MFKRIQVVGVKLTTKHCGPVVDKLSSQPWQSIDIVAACLEIAGQQSAGSLSIVVQEEVADEVDEPFLRGTKASATPLESNSCSAVKMIFMLSQSRVFL